MRERVTAVAIGAVLGFGAFAAAQAPPYTVRADKHILSGTLSAEPPGWTLKQRMLTGNVVLEVNGVIVRADQAVITDGEVTFEGNVRLTLPQSK